MSYNNQYRMQSTDSKYLDEYRIIKTLGQGYHAKVKLAQGPDHKLVAIKRFKPQTANLGVLKHELDILKQLNHQNLVNLVDVRPNSTYKKRNGETYPCFAIILEYVGGGQLFDFVALGGKFSPNVARTYFYQLMNAVHYMHEKGIAHRDIKPENILLTDNYTLKLTDFGFSTPLAGKDKSGILRTKLGTEGYMAPQIQTKNYEGKKADIFSCGVILFIMYTASPPFERSVPNDPYYKLIKDKNYASFWNFHGKRRPAGFFTDDFKDLINKMLAYNPTERPSMVEISQHAWVKGPVLSNEALRQQFAQRKRKVDEHVERQKNQQKQKKKARTNALYNQEAVHRADDQSIQIFKEHFQNFQGKHELPLVRKPGFVINEQQDYFYSSLLTFLSSPVPLDFEDFQVSFKPRYEVKENKVNITFSYNEDEDVKQQKIIRMQISVGKTQTGKLNLDFDIVEGSDIYFKRLVNSIKDEFIQI